MTNAIENIMNQLNEVFAPLDAQVLADSQAWAKGRVAALKEYRDSDEAKETRRQKDGVWAYYEKLFRIAGGKSWHKVFDGNNEAGIEREVAKNAERIAKSRNASITKKLIKANVSEVIESGFTRSSDGFNGFFNVETDQGHKRVNIQTIVAGGYNIQCAHMRVLVNVK